MNNIIATGELKECTGCGNVLPESSEFFSKSKNGKNGLRAKCKKCNKIYRKKHYQENHEEIRSKQNVYLKKYHLENKEKISLNKKDYYVSNKEKIIRYNKSYRIANLDKVKKYKAQYKKLNAEQFRIYKQSRRSRQKNLPYTFTKKQWEAAKEFFGYKCAYCGNADDLSQDHFVPLAKDGEYTRDNIIPACVVCNSSKQDKDFFEWYGSYDHYNEYRERKILKYLGYQQNKIQQLSIL